MKKIILICTFLCYSISSFAITAVTSTAPSNNSFKNEIMTNISSGSLYIEKSCKYCDSLTSIFMQASYLYHLQDKIQVGAEGGLIFVSGWYSQTLINITGVGVYNIDSDLSNTFFLKAGLGLFTIATRGTNTENTFGAFIGGGKRFHLLPNVNYVPEFRLVKKGDLDIGIQATLLNFSINWN